MYLQLTSNANCIGVDAWLSAWSDLLIDEIGRFWCIESNFDTDWFTIELSWTDFGDMSTVMENMAYFEIGTEGFKRNVQG